MVKYVITSSKDIDYDYNIQRAKLQTSLSGVRQIRSVKVRTFEQTNLEY